MGWSHLTGALAASVAKLHARAWERVDESEVLLGDVIKVKFVEREKVSWCTGEVWRLHEATAGKPRAATVVYHQDGESEEMDLSGPSSHAWVRLHPALPAPSVLLQATSHAFYVAGLLARSTPINEPTVSRLKPGVPLLVLPDAKVARIFDVDQSHRSGGRATVVTTGWGNERAGDLLLQMDGACVSW